MNLEFAAIGKQAQVLMVTSAVAEEGKSTTFANLAVASALAGRNVALVDLDLHRPVLARFFRVNEGHPGLSAVVLGHVGLDEALVPIALENRIPEAANGSSASVSAGGSLVVLPTGILPPDPGEFVGVEGVRHVIGALRDRFDVVLIDAPPLLAIGDGLTIAGFSDAIVAVVRADFARRDRHARVRGNARERAAGQARVRRLRRRWARRRVVRCPVRLRIREGSREGGQVSEGLAQAEFVAALDDARARRVRFSTTASKRRRGWLVRRVLLAADVAGLLTAFLLAELVTADSQSGRFDLPAEVLLFVATLPAWVLVARLYGLYSHDDQRTNHTTTDEVANVFNMVTVCTWLFFAFSWLSGAAHPQVAKLLLFWAFAARARPARPDRRPLRRTPEHGLRAEHGDRRRRRRRPDGRREASPPSRVRRQRRRLRRLRSDGARASVGDLTILGPPDELQSIVQAHDVERVIIAFSRVSHERVLALIRSLKDAFVQVDIVPRYYELVRPEHRAQHDRRDARSVSSRRARSGRRRKFLKRTMDVAIALFALRSCTPLFLVVTLAI